ncbi:hypothetical protein F5887DRAFT_1079169 [Amanita rubescens]|nr:hypothetical protein F5887DRAFT_1079169 [Amanita rubescens]
MSIPAVMPFASDDTPTFSRHNINDKVILPVRKPPSRPRHDSTSFSFSEDITLAFKKATVTWTKATEELKNSSARSPISSRLSVISFGLFNFAETKPAVSMRDPYDPWPYIPDEIENKITEDEGEGDSIGSIIKAALDLNRVLKLGKIA